jgi:hypothetical protein
MMAKNKGGRPLIWTEEKVMKLGDDLFNWMLDSQDNIWMETFLYENNEIYPQFISEMCIKYSKFSELIKKVKKIQEGKIVNGALKHNLNPTMSIFLLKNHHGYRDKQEQDINHKGESIVINVIKPNKDNNGD